MERRDCTKFPFGRSFNHNRHKFQFGLFSYSNSFFAPDNKIPQHFIFSIPFVEFHQLARLFFIINICSGSFQFIGIILPLLRSQTNRKNHKYYLANYEERELKSTCYSDELQIKFSSDAWIHNPVYGWKIVGKLSVDGERARMGSFWYMHLVVYRVQLSLTLSSHLL